MYQRILVPIDGSATSGRGLDEAIRLAALTGGRLRLLHVIDDLSFALGLDAYGGDPGNWLGRLRTDAEALLERARGDAAAASVEADTLILDDVRGAVHDQIVAQAQAWGADLLVLGTHGRRGIGRWLMGSSAESILRLSPVPVLLVRAPESLPATDAPDAAERFTVPGGTLANQ